MIVKVKQPKQNGWDFFGNVRNIQSNIVDGNKLEFPGIESDIEEHQFLTKEVFELDSNGKPNKHADVLELLLTCEDGRLVHILANTLTYLMNDEGKTIERLFPKNV